MHVERRQHGVRNSRDIARTPGKPDNRDNDRRIDDQDDLRAPRRHHRRIAGELNGVAQSLIGADHDGFAVDGFLARAIWAG